MPRNIYHWRKDFKNDSKLGENPRTPDVPCLLHVPKSQGDLFAGLEKLTVPKKLLMFNLHNWLPLVLKINDQHWHVLRILNTCRLSSHSASHPPSHGYNSNSTALSDGHIHQGLATFRENSQTHREERSYYSAKFTTKIYFYLILTWDCARLVDLKGELFLCYRYAHWVMSNAPVINK